MTMGIWARRIVLAAVVTLPLAAHASDGSYSATLAKPVDAPREIITDNIVWHCEGTSCVAAGDVHGASVWTCHQLTDQLGDVTAYGSAAHQFDADHLAKCNSH